MKLAAIAGVLLALTCVVWIGAATLKDAEAGGRCEALQETVDGLNDAIEFIAVMVSDAPCCTAEDVDALRARKVRRPAC